MAERKLRRLSRRELIEIIYALEKKDAEQQTKIDRLEQQLAGRMVILENAGSIADAVVALNDLFAVAQRTADDYLQSVRAAAKAFAPEQPAEPSDKNEAVEEQQ